MAVLEFNDVTKVYRSGIFRRSETRALDGFSLRVEAGEIFGFLGPNGAGKTTAIHIALGLAFATSGTGTLLDNRFGHARTRRRIGFLAENVSFYNLSAASLLHLSGRLQGVRDPQLRQRTRELLQAFDLTDVDDRKVSKLSRGMLQRAGLAQALINDPELLILDEPTSALDPAARVAVRETLLAVKRAGKTVFLSSHLLSEIELICDRIAIVHRGRVVRIGTVAELVESDEEFEITARRTAAADGSIRRVVPAAQQRAAIERLWSEGAEIVSVTPKRKTLEEVFLALTSGSEEKRP